MEHLKELLFEPHTVRSPLIAFGGLITADALKGALEWIVLVATAFVLVTQALTWIVKRFVCRPHDGSGGCQSCRYFGRWLCPGPRKTDKHKLVENQYD